MISLHVVNYKSPKPDLRMISTILCGRMFMIYMKYWKDTQFAV